VSATPPETARTKRWLPHPAPPSADAVGGRPSHSAMPGKSGRPHRGRKSGEGGSHSRLDPPDVAHACRGVRASGLRRPDHPPRDRRDRHQASNRDEAAPAPVGMRRPRRAGGGRPGGRDGRPNHIVDRRCALAPEVIRAWRSVRGGRADRDQVLGRTEPAPRKPHHIRALVRLSPAFHDVRLVGFQAVCRPFSPTVASASSVPSIIPLMGANLPQLDKNPRV
jgi:hypothetical protein